MAANSKDYWKAREEENLRRCMREEAKYIRELNNTYEYMQRQIQKEIDSFYARYAAREGISIAEAKRRANKLDIDAYAEKAKRYVKEKNFSELANAEMKLYNLTMKVNRLELLKAQIGLELAAGFNEIEKKQEQILKQRAQDELARQAGILGKTLADNAKMANAIVNASFKNAKFSDRIWMHQEMLKAEIDKLLKIGLIQGRNPRELARQLRKAFDVSRYNSERLMHTELARVQTEAQKQSYIDNGYDRYQFHALGLKACEICRDIDGKDFPIEKMMPGDNAPPMHPNCRCSTSAYIDRAEYDKWLDGYKEHRLSFADWKKNNSEKVKFPGNRFSNSKSKTAEELLTMTQLGDKIIKKHTSIESKWSGKVNRLIDDGINFSGKEWNCDIALLNTAATHQAVHELLHARSISHYETKYAPDIYYANRPMEELPVELFTKEILNAEGIVQVSSRAYGLSIKRLRMINHKTGMYSTDYDFAKALFAIPLVGREQWLRDKIFENSKTLVDYNRTVKYLEKVLKWK